jgi:hydrogenase nickel incorporation protein HypA/HybF
MHELSVVQSIVRFAEKEVTKRKAKNVAEIDLDIGDLSGIEFNSFEFAWPIGVRNTVLENSKRNVNHVSGEAICCNCGNQYRVRNLYDECPSCHKFNKEVIQGKELKIKKLKLNL